MRQFEDGTYIASWVEGGNDMLFFKGNQIKSLQLSTGDWIKPPTREMKDSANWAWIADSPLRWPEPESKEVCERCGGSGEVPSIEVLPMEPTAPCPDCKGE